MLVLELAVDTKGESSVCQLSWMKRLMPSTRVPLRLCASRTDERTANRFGPIEGRSLLCLSRVYRTGDEDSNLIATTRGASVSARGADVHGRAGAGDGNLRLKVARGGARENDVEWK